MLNFRVTEEEAALLAAYSEHVGQSMTDVVRAYIRSLESKIRRVTPQAIQPYILPSLPLERTDLVPPVSAIYFVLTAAGDVLYVGQTANLAVRHVDHHRHVAALEIDPLARLHWFEKRGERERFERACIARFAPRLNRKRSV